MPKRIIKETLKKHQSGTYFINIPKAEIDLLKLIKGDSVMLTLEKYQNYKSYYCKRCELHFSSDEKEFEDVFCPTCSEHDAIINSEDLESIEGVEDEN